MHYLEDFTSLQLNVPVSVVYKNGQILIYYNGQLNCNNLIRNSGNAVKAYHKLLLLSLGRI